MNRKKHIIVSLVGLVAVPLVAHAVGVNVTYPQYFKEYLANNYSFVASLEDGDSTDQIDSHVMSDRAVAAFNGNTVLPLTPDEVRLVRSTREELNGGRNRLMRVLNNPVKMQQYPQDIAYAQVAYDCWALHQQAEPNASHNMVKCEANFNRLIAALDTPPPVAAKTWRYDVLTTDNVYFGWDESTLSDDAKTMLDKLRDNLNSANDPTRHVALQGFADRSGPADYNQKLSERRLEAVRQYLGVKPVNTEEVDLRAYGETNLPVSTADGAREPRNRTVVIAIVRDTAQQ